LSFDEFGSLRIKGWPTYKNSECNHISDVLGIFLNEQPGI